MNPNTLRIFIIGAAALVVVVGVLLLTQGGSESAGSATSGQAAQSASATAPAAGTAAAAQPNQTNSKKMDVNTIPWESRCGKRDDGAEQCTAMTGIFTKDNQRIVEVNIRKGQKGETDYVGRVILPLGVSLLQPARMRIDDGDVFAFQISHCDQGGCYGFVNIDNALADKMKNGKLLFIAALNASGSDINIQLALENFAKAMQGVK